LVNENLRRGEFVLLQVQVMPQTFSWEYVAVLVNNFLVVNILNSDIFVFGGWESEQPHVQMGLWTLD